MIVYIESNFVLELAFLREEYRACDEILALAETGNISLVLPAFSIAEPYGTVGRRIKQRRELRNKLWVEINELARSKPYEERSEELMPLTNLLLRSNEEEENRLDTALDTVLSSAEVIPLEKEIIRNAVEFRQSRNLSSPDAIVYASILKHLAGKARAISCFLTKDAGDFVSPDIKNELASYNCELLTRFKDGLGYIRSYI